MKLKAEGISFCYEKGGRQILTDCSIEVDSGERIGLMARSGSGKTTLCKILAGYEKPEGGSVTLDGAPLGSFRGRCPVQMVFQHPEQSVNPREGGVSPGEMTERLGIREEWLTRYPDELSGGELQRFCIARALGEETRFLLADEITAMLDLASQKEIWLFLLEELERRNIGLIAVSHSEKLLEEVCHRVIGW